MGDQFKSLIKCNIQFYINNFIIDDIINNKSAVYKWI